MNFSLFFTVVTLLGSVYIWIGNKAAKGIRNGDDYFLMGRNLSFLSLFLTFLATQLGGGSLLGAAQEGYEKGWLVLLYPLGICFGFLTLGLGFGGKLRKLNISTVAEIFEKIYASREQRYIASGISIITAFLILVAQVIAARLFFVTMGVESPILFIFFWSVLVIYTVMGGLKAVVNTDILQALFIVSVLCVAYFFADTSLLANASSLSASAPAWNREIPWSNWLFLPFLFMLIEQDMGQRCFAAKNPRVIRYAALAAGAVLLLSSAVAIYFGIAAKQMDLSFSSNSSVLLRSVELSTNPIVYTLFTAAIFMAVISTADSLLCSISSNLAYDFLGQKRISEKKRVKVAQLLTLMTGIASLCMAFLFDNVLSVLMMSYELSVCALFVPITIAIVSNRPCKAGAYSSIICGLTGFVLFRLLNVSFCREIMTVFLSLGGYLLGRQIWMRRPKTQVFAPPQRKKG